MSAAAGAVTLATRPPPASEEVVADRMAAGRIGAAIVFVALLVLLGMWARALGRRARSAEEEGRLQRAFREIERDLSSDKKGKAP